MNHLCLLNIDKYVGEILKGQFLVTRIVLLTFITFIHNLLSNYVSEEEIDGATFLKLQDDDLKSLGLKMGPRIKLRNIIKAANDRIKAMGIENTSLHLSSSIAFDSSSTSHQSPISLLHCSYSEDSSDSIGDSSGVKNQIRVKTNLIDVSETPIPGNSNATVCLVVFR